MWVGRVKGEFMGGKDRLCCKVMVMLVEVSVKGDERKGEGRGKRCGVGRVKGDVIVEEKICYLG